MLWCCEKDKAVAYAQDLSGLEGFGQYTTGGKKPVLVENERDFSHALRKGNIAVIAPGAPLGINIGTLQLPDDFTLDAPGDNLILRGSLRPGSNNVLRRFRLADAIGDCIWVDPCSKSNIWLDRLVIKGAKDGALDIASSKLDKSSPKTYITVSDCEFLRINKTCLLNSKTESVGANKIFASFYRNKFTNCGQRQPRVGFDTVVECIGNHHLITPQEGGAAYGIAIIGGELFCKDEVFESTVAHSWAIRMFHGKATIENITVQEGMTSSFVENGTYEVAL